jgi:predicted dehydrogenase
MWEHQRRTSKHSERPCNAQPYGGISLTETYPKAPPRVLLVGLGRFGMNHLRVLRGLAKHQHCTISGIVDISPERLANNMVSDLKASTSIDDFLDLSDAVDVVTSSDTHFELVKKCLRAGKDVFVEKPLCATYEQARQLAYEAHVNRRVLGVGHIFRYHPTVLKVKSMLQHFGEVTMMDGRYMGTAGPRQDSGVLLNLAIHLVDTFSFILSEEPRSVMGYCHKFNSKSKFEDHSILVLKFPSGAVGIATSSWFSSKKARDLTVVGEKLIASVDLETNILRTPSDSIVATGPEPLMAEIMDFLDCVASRGSPKSNGETAAAAIQVVENAIKSNDLGRPIEIDQ